jgi:hexosaminidase
MTATASSRYSDAYLPAYAIDGNCQTFWHSAPGATKPLPATLRLDLGGHHTVDGITYLPRQDGNGNGLITGYEVSVSTDGSAFRPVASGTWPADATRKTVRFPAVDASHVRLTATAGTGGVASVAELEVGDAGP